MVRKLVITVLLLATLLVYAQAVKVSGANPAVLETDSQVLAKLVVTDLNAFAAQWRADVKKVTAKVGGREVAAVSISVNGVRLTGRSSDAGAVLYYRGKASGLKALVQSPYVQLAYVKVVPEVPPEGVLRRGAQLGGGLPHAHSANHEGDNRRC